MQHLQTPLKSASYEPFQRKLFSTRQSLCWHSAFLFPIFLSLSPSLPLSFLHNMALALTTFSFYVRILDDYLLILGTTK